MLTKPFGNFVVLAVIACAMLSHSTATAGKPSPQLLGPTGLTGLISSKTIKVTDVAKGSPADGKVKKGTQIIGIGKGPFKTDPKRVLAAAIDEAETKAAGGKLTLILKGNKEVVIQLKVLGSYSATAPYDCPKTNTIITQIADSLVNRKKAGLGATNSTALGLMATGEKKYQDTAYALIKSSKLLQVDAAKVDALLKGDIDMGYVGWYWGYALITLGEYYLLTQDESVLPAMKTYALGLARGQDAGGLWGHRMATVARGGRLPGYAQMNQPSISNLMGMLYAKKCGIKAPALDQGIATTYAYVESHVAKGAFPYGVHGPQTRYFNNNGTSGSAAVCMALKGNTQGTQFFSQLSATAFDNLEQGHASSFFNPLWTPIGANFSGPEVTQRFFRKTLWYHNLHRRWDGGYGRAGKEGTEAGAALLAYCLPRKALLITGRDADKSIWITGKDATAVVMMSKMDYKSKSDDELIALAQKHPIPHVRRQASAALGERRDTLTNKWVNYLKNGTDEQKLLAISQYGWWIPMDKKKDRLDDIGAILRDPKASLNVRVTAAGSVCHFGEPANTYYMDIVKLIAQDRPEDRFGEIDQSLGKSLVTLCKTPFGKGLVTDKHLFYKAASKLMDHKRQDARASGVTMLADMPLADFHRVADKVMHIIENKDSTYHSYHAVQGSVGAALSLLANLNIKEGIAYTVASLDNPGKWGFKVRMLCATLPKYGGNAKDALQKLKADPRFKKIQKDRFAGIWNKMVKAIEEDKNPKRLITLEEAKNMGRK